MVFDPPGLPFSQLCFETVGTAPVTELWNSKRSVLKPVLLNIGGRWAPRAGGDCVMCGESRLVGHMMAAETFIVELYCLVESGPVQGSMFEVCFGCEEAELLSNFQNLLRASASILPFISNT